VDLGVDALTAAWPDPAEAQLQAAIESLVSRDADFTGIDGLSVVARE